jgi:ADP-ribosylation factor GTPase-activating protein 1
MDSWTPAQLALMKAGGNQKCNDYLQKHGIAPRTPIKQKYESPAAQLYKEVLKARVEGRPEPTELPKPVVKQAYVPQQQQNTDSNSMERLPGETEQQYVARQTRLREEARARMAAKFGGSGRMQGIGSDPNYSSSGGYGGGGGGGVDVDSLVSGFSNVMGSVGQSVSNLLQEDQVQSLKAKGGSFWGTFTSGVSQLASSVTAADSDDGLSALQRQVASQKPSQSIYSGFGSDQAAAGGGFASNSSSRASTPSATGSNLQEAPGLPGEDRNGIERLTGESDEQYVMRQTRLREEARARMAAKFGSGGLSSASSSSAQHNRTASAPASGSNYNAAPAPSSGNRMDNYSSPARPSAPSSGNAFPRPPATTPPKQPMDDVDFFSSFGT